VQHVISLARGNREVYVLSTAQDRPFTANSYLENGCNWQTKSGLVGEDANKIDFWDIPNCRLFEPPV